MTINKQKLFTFKDSWIWVVVMSILTVPAVLAVIHAGGHLPIGAWTTLTATAAASLYIAMRRYVARWHWVDSIQFYTSQGIAVWNDTVGMHLKIEQATEEVIKFWSDNVLFKNHAKQLDNTCIDIRNAINGSTLAFSSVPIDIHGYGSFSDKLVRGFDSGTNMGVYLDLKDMEETVKVIKHELGHICLDTVGIADEAASHKAMKDAGFLF